MCPGEQDLLLLQSRFKRQVPRPEDLARRGIFRRAQVASRLGVESSSLANTHCSPSCRNSRTNQMGQLFAGLSSGFLQPVLLPG